MTSDLAVIACYFSPCGYKKPQENCRRFYRYMKQFPVKVIIVECAFFGRPFELEFADLQVCSESVMFQKERLWNLGGHLAKSLGYKKLAFFDADVIFDNDDWPDLISETLDKYKVAQCFEKSVMVFDNTQVELDGAIKHFLDDIQINHINANRGMAWCMQADTFEQVEFYDVTVLGSGDTCLCIACMLPFVDSTRWLQWVNNNEEHFRASKLTGRCHFIQWAQHFADVVGKDVGYVPQIVRSMPHGTIEGRNYRNRHLLVEGIDCSKDLIRVPGKPLEWTESGLKYKSAVMSYFVARREDDPYPVKWFT